MSHEELLPCPFCGGEAVCGVDYDIASDYWFIKCANPDCPCTVTREYRDVGDISGEDRALAAWNRRTPAPMTSVIQWVRYDGTPETLPDNSGGVLLFRGGDRYASYYHAWDNVWRGLYKTNWLDGSHPKKGDIWAYLPTPSEQQGEDPRGAVSE